MRILSLYALVDERAKTIVGPIVHDHSAVPIVRQITDAVNKPDSLVGKNPEDFALYELGTVDEETGQITALSEPQRITTALALKATQG